MKRTLSLILALVLAGSMLGCGSKAATATASETVRETREQQPTQAATEAAQVPEADYVQIMPTDMEGNPNTQGTIVKILFDSEQVQLSTKRESNDTTVYFARKEDPGSNLLVCSVLGTVQEMYSMDAAFYYEDYIIGDLMERTYLGLPGAMCEFVSRNPGEPIWRIGYIQLTEEICMTFLCLDTDVHPEEFLSRAVLHIEEGTGEPYLPEREQDMEEAEGISVESVISYEAPEALGDSPQSMIYSLDGVLYRFPTPVAQFMANGWTIPSFFIDQFEYIPPQDYVQLVLEKDGGVNAGSGKVLYEVFLNNPTDEEIPLEKGVVTWMYVVAGQSNVDLQLPGGISMNSTEPEVRGANVDGTTRYDTGAIAHTWTGENSVTITALFGPVYDLMHVEFNAM